MNAIEEVLEANRRSLSCRWLVQHWEATSKFPHHLTVSSRVLRSRWSKAGVSSPGRRSKQVLYERCPCNTFTSFAHHRSCPRERKSLIQICTTVFARDTRTKLNVTSDSLREGGSGFVFRDNSWKFPHDWIWPQGRFKFRLFLHLDELPFRANEIHPHYVDIYRHEYAIFIWVSE